MATCKNCNNKIPNSIIVDGVQRNLSSRYYCLDCSPFGVAKHTWSHPNLELRLKRSLVWKVDESVFREAVETSLTMTDCLSRFGLLNIGGNNRTVKKRAIHLNISLEHFNKNKHPPRERIPLVTLLKEGVSVGSHNLKLRLFKEGLLLEKCNKCGVGSKWCGERLSLHLDHINGDRLDNRLVNLRILCPNCHSQTKNYCGKALKKNRSPIFNNSNSLIKKVDTEISISPTAEIEDKHIVFLSCFSCGALTKKTKGVARCVNCSRVASRKAVRPSLTELIEILSTNSYRSVGKMYGVSDNAIRKWVRQYGLDPKDIGVK